MSQRTVLCKKSKGSALESSRGLTLPAEELQATE